MSITAYLNKNRIVLALVLSTVLGTAQANEPPVYKLTLAETWGGEYSNPRRCTEKHGEIGR